MWLRQMHGMHILWCIVFTLNKARVLIQPCLLPETVVPSPMHKGFPLYNLMSGLMPGIGKGTHAFHPSEQTHGASSTILTMIHESTSGNETESSTTTAALPSPIIQPSTNPVSPTTHLQHCTTPSVTNELPPSSPQSATSSNNHMPPPSSL